MNEAIISKIRPVLWKVHVQDKERAEYVRGALKLFGLNVGVPEEEPGLLEPPVYSFTVQLSQDASLTEEDLLAILQGADLEASFSRQERPAHVAVSSTRVLLVDDHPVIRRGLADLLRGQSEIEVIGEASDGEEAVAMAIETQPDVVLMDVSMPKLSGPEATRRIKSQLPTTRVIGLSAHEEPAVAMAMRDAGADHYLWKNATPEAVLTAVLERAAPT